MIISKTPFRISLFGGGSDYPTWIKEHGGCAIGGSINKYCYLSARKLPAFFDHKHRLVYSKIELFNKIDEILHPAVRGVFEYLEVVEGFEVHHFSDLPGRSGLGSSSAFTVGLLNAMSYLLKKPLTKTELNETAIHIEQNVIKENVGCQDQTMVAHGGFNFIHFDQSGLIDVSPVRLTYQRLKKLEDSLMLFFTGISRISDENARKIIKNLTDKSDGIKQVMILAKEAHHILENRNKNIDQIGEMLDEAWEIKKTFADSISNKFVDDIYKKAKDAGALGGKLIGSGGGGFLLLYANPAHQDAIRNELKDLLEIGFRFENEGSKVLKIVDGDI